MKIDAMLDNLYVLSSAIHSECNLVERELAMNPHKREYNQGKYDLLHKLMRQLYLADGDFTSCKNFMFKMLYESCRKQYEMNDNKIPLPMHDPNVALEIVKHELWERLAFYASVNGNSKFLRNMSFDELEALIDKIKLERDKKRLLEL